MLYSRMLYGLNAAMKSLRENGGGKKRTKHRRSEFSVPDDSEVLMLLLFICSHMYVYTQIFVPYYNTVCYCKPLYKIKL